MLGGDEQPILFSSTKYVLRVQARPSDAPIPGPVLFSSLLFQVYYNCHPYGLKMLNGCPSRQSQLSKRLANGYRMESIPDLVN